MAGLEKLVRIRTIFGGESETVPAGTLAGAGCFRCEGCGYAVALQELDEVPTCPNCGGEDFRRGSIFGGRSADEPTGLPVETPEWTGAAPGRPLQPGRAPPP